MGCGRGPVFGLEGLCCKLRKNSISANHLYSLGTGPGPLDSILTLTPGFCHLNMVHEASSCSRHPRHVPCSFPVAYASSPCPIWLQYGPGCCQLPPVASAPMTKSDLCIVSIHLILFFMSNQQYLTSQTLRITSIDFIVHIAL